MSDSAADFIWYFAYGSNLDPDTFLGRRRMEPRVACCARLDGYRLTFDLPVGSGERGVANLRRARGANVHGVAYEISRDQAHFLDRTEGVHRGYYRREVVSLIAMEGDPIDGFTYLSARGVEGRKPSRRYLGLLLRGARHHGLPETWVRTLRELDLAHDERERQRDLPL